MTPVKLISQEQYVMALNVVGEELWRYNVGVQLKEEYSLNTISIYKRYVLVIWTETAS